MLGPSRAARVAVSFSWLSARCFFQKSNSPLQVLELPTLSELEVALFDNRVGEAVATTEEKWPATWHVAHGTTRMERGRWPRP